MPSLSDLRGRFAPDNTAACLDCPTIIRREAGGRMPERCPPCALKAIAVMAASKLTAAHIGMDFGRRDSTAIVVVEKGKVIEAVTLPLEPWCEHWPRLLDKETAERIPCAWPGCERGADHPHHTGMKWKGTFYTRVQYDTKGDGRRWTWADSHGSFIKAKALRK